MTIHKLHPPKRERHGVTVHVPDKLQVDWLLAMADAGLVVTRSPYGHYSITRAHLLAPRRTK